MSAMGNTTDSNLQGLLVTTKDGYIKDYDAKNWMWIKSSNNTKSSPKSATKSLLRVTVSPLRSSTGRKPEYIHENCIV